MLNVEFIFVDGIDIDRLLTEGFMRIVKPETNNIDDCIEEVTMINIVRKVGLHDVIIVILARNFMIFSSKN